MNKKYKLGIYYDIIEYYDDIMVLLDLDGNEYIYYPLANKKEKINYHFKKYIAMNLYYPEGYAIDNKGNLVSYGPENTIFSDYSEKVKNAIVISEKHFFVLTFEGNLYHSKNNLNKIEYFKLIKDYIKQIIEIENENIIILNKNGSISMIKSDFYESRLGPVYEYKSNNLIDIKIPNKVNFEYIAGSTYSNKIFLRDDNKFGWILDLETGKFTNLEIKLKEAYYIESNLIGLKYTGQLILFKSDKRVPLAIKNITQIYNIGDNLITEQSI